MQIAQIESTEMQLGHAMAAEDVMSTIQRPHTNSLQASSQNEASTLKIRRTVNGPLSVVVD